MANDYLDSLFSLNNKIAVITGAGGHLCSEMARGLSYSGCFVALLDIRIEKVKTVENKLKEEGYKNVISIEMNVEKKDDHINALKKITSEFGKVDILINGAGINDPKNFFEISEKEWNSVLSSQVTGTFFGCQVFGEHMIKNNKGSKKIKKS